MEGCAAERVFPEVIMPEELIVVPLQAGKLAQHVPLVVVINGDGDPGAGPAAG